MIRFSAFLSVGIWNCPSNTPNNFGAASSAFTHYGMPNTVFARRRGTSFLYFKDNFFTRPCTNGLFGESSRGMDIYIDGGWHLWPHSGSMNVLLVDGHAENRKPVPGTQRLTKGFHDRNEQTEI